MIEWECSECGSNSDMPKEFGCDYCQHFTNERLVKRINLGKKLIAEIYKVKEKEDKLSGRRYK